MENYKIKRVNEVKKWEVLCMKWLAILLTLIFAIAKVIGYFPWSWWLVFTPALAYVVLALILLIVLLIAALFYKDE